MNRNRDLSYDHVLGMFEGGAVGDALGAPFEFRNSISLSKYTGIIEYPNRLINRFQGTRYSDLGQVTDDTEMTLTLARSLLRNQGYSEEDLILSYERWANSGNTFLGTNTRSLLKGVTTVRGYRGRYKRGMNGTLKGMRYPDLTHVQSNGTLMRCSSLALLPEVERAGKDAVKQDVYLTNPNPVNLECSRLYLEALRSLIRSPESPERKPIFTSLEDRAEQEPVKKVFEDVRSGSPRDLTHNKGWVAHAFYTSMWSLYQLEVGEVGSDSVRDSDSVTYQDLIDAIIRSGGDTDTNAAIAGCLVGAWFGSDCLGREERTTFNRDKVYSADSSKADFPRLPEHTITDLRELTQSLVDTF